MSEEKFKWGCTFIYGCSSHVVETQGCVHIIYVLQESKKVLNLLERDALHKKRKCLCEKRYNQTGTNHFLQLL